MNFFGLTSLGPEYTMSPHLRTTLNISDLSPAQLAAAFAAFSQRHRKDGLLCGDDIRPLLIQTYGREPPEIEVREFLRLVELRGAALPPLAGSGFRSETKYVNAEQFSALAEEVREAMAKIEPAAATEFTSHGAMTALKDKNTTVRFGPHEKYRTPVTTSQEYGWQTQMPHERVERKPMRSCDVTQFQAEMIKSGQY